MLPLALILQSRGFSVEGSDRSYDQGRTPEKFEFLQRNGIRLWPQDGSGITSPEQTLVTSSAIEETVPDMLAARAAGASRMGRAELLASLSNSAEVSITVGGTSGKSTTTGMIGWMLSASGQNPTIVNGAVMKNFVTRDQPFASMQSGRSELFVVEADESDGTISLYRPTIAVLTNIALDHKSLAELQALFSAYAGSASKAVINADNDICAHIAAQMPADRRLTFSMRDRSADLFATDIVLAADGASCLVHDGSGQGPARMCLQTPGEHNIANALAALAAVRAYGLDLHTACRALMSFTGIRRRFEVVGVSRDIAVIDDFAHNPDKLRATLKTACAMGSRVLSVWQPHGFGPLRLMRNELIAAFAASMRPEDRLFIPEPVYFGGTTDRAVTSFDIAEGVRASGASALAFNNRDECASAVLMEARPGDIILIMGARDDTLSEYAASILTGLRERRS